jgi:hypothetical protein
MICSSCERSYGETETLCPRCRMALVPEESAPAAPQPGGPPAPEGLAHLRGADLAFITVLAEKLEEAGIPHQIAADPQGRGRDIRYDLGVRLQDMERARLIDAEVLRAELPDLPEGFEPFAEHDDTCPACGAQLAATDEACPSCDLALITPE